MGSGLFVNFIQALKHKYIQHRFAVAAIESFNEPLCIALAGLMNSRVTPYCSIVQSELERIGARTFVGGGFLLQAERVFSLGWIKAGLRSR
jgi:hypothetical protein